MNIISDVNNFSFDSFNIQNITSENVELDEHISKMFDNIDDDDTKSIKWDVYVENANKVFTLSDPARWLLYAILVSQISQLSPEDIERMQDNVLPDKPDSVLHNNGESQGFQDNKMAWVAIALMSNFFNNLKMRGGGGEQSHTEITADIDHNHLLEIALKNYIYGMELRMHQYVSYFAGDETYRITKAVLEMLVSKSNKEIEDTLKIPTDNSTDKPIQTTPLVPGGNTASKPTRSILDVYSLIEPYLQLKEHEGRDDWSRLRAYFYKEGPPFVQTPSRLYVFGAAYIHHQRHHQRSPSSSFAPSE